MRKKEDEKKRKTEKQRDVRQEGERKRIRRGPQRTRAQEPQCGKEPLLRDRTKSTAWCWPLKDARTRQQPSMAGGLSGCPCRAQRKYRLAESSFALACSVFFRGATEEKGQEGLLNPCLPRGKVQVYLTRISHVRPLCSFLFESSLVPLWFLFPVYCCLMPLVASLSKPVSLQKRKQTLSFFPNWMGLASTFPEHLPFFPSFPGVNTVSLSVSRSIALRSCCSFVSFFPSFCLFCPSTKALNH